MKQFNGVPRWGYNNGMTRVSAVYDDGQTLEEAKAHFQTLARTNHLVTVRRVEIGGYDAFEATEYN